MKKLLLTAFILVAFYTYISDVPSNGTASTNAPTFTPIATQLPTKDTSFGPHKSQHTSALKNAIERKRSKVQVEGSGRVIKVLKDDLKGSRHQKFLLRLSSDYTLLVAHNIDLAPRIQGLQKGDKVKFYGQYEWNAKGGVIHWTHKDPRGRDKSGWLKHEGRVYQ